MHNEDYFADDNTGTCGARSKVVVSIFAKPLGVGSNFQGACVNDLSEALITNPQLGVVGNDLKWYADNTTLTPITAATILSDDTIYYVSQTNPVTNCETLRLQVYVNIGLVPVPTGNAIQEFCTVSSNPPPTVGDLSASGQNNWYLTNDFGIPLDFNTPLVDGQFYYATTIDPPCESVGRLKVMASLLRGNESGISGQRNICISEIASTTPFDLFDLLGGTPDNTGTWSGPISTLNGHQGTVDVSSLTISGVSLVFTYTVSSATCPPATSTVTINLVPLPTVTVNSPVICAGNLANIVATPSPAGTYEYFWTVPLGVPNPGNVANFTTAIEGLYSVVVTNLSNSCSSVLGSGTVSVTPVPTVIVNSPPVCFGDSVTVTAIPNPSGNYNYVWTVPSGAINPGNTASFTTSTAGNYNVVITDLLTTCQSLPAQGTAIFNLIPTVTVSSPPECLGTPVTVTAIPNPAGVYDYTWTVPVGATDPGNTSNFTTTTAGDYSVIITDKNTTCPSLPGLGTVIINLIPTVSISSPPTCLGTPATVTAITNPSGNYDYFWTVPAGEINPGNTASFTTTTAGDYSVTINDINTACPSLPAQGTVNLI